MSAESRNLSAKIQTTLSLVSTVTSVPNSRPSGVEGACTLMRELLRAIPVAQRSAAVRAHGVHIRAQHLTGRQAAPFVRRDPARRDVRQRREPPLLLRERQL